MPSARRRGEPSMKATVVLVELVLRCEGLRYRGGRRKEVRFVGCSQAGQNFPKYLLCSEALMDGFEGSDLFPGNLEAATTLVSLIIAIRPASH